MDAEPEEEVCMLVPMSPTQQDGMGAMGCGASPKQPPVCLSDMQLVSAEPMANQPDVFDVSLVMSYDSFGQWLGQQANKLRLKYFVIMTGFKASTTKCKFIGYSQYNSS